MRFSALLTLFATAATTPLIAEDWPRWRGANADGISTEAIPDFADKEPARLWETKVGMGFAAVVVAEGKLYTTGNTDDADALFCLDALTGKEIWKHSYPEPLDPKYYEGGTSATPTVSEGVVYQLSRKGKLFALDAATGSVKWQSDVVADHGLPFPEWGFAGAPVVYGDNLLLNVGDAGMVVKKANGEVVWKSAAEPSGYSTPFLATIAGKEQMIVTNGKAYVGVDPASGSEFWRHTWETRYGVNAADPQVTGSQIFISTDYGKGCCLIDVAKAPEVEVLFENKNLETQMNPSLLIDGHLYGVSGNEGKDTKLKCISMESGETVWEYDSPKCGSAMAVNGGKTLVLLTGRGELSIAPTSTEGFNPTLTMQALGGRCWTVPVLANGLLYCRNSSGELVCLDLRG
jgi:outer membrane protein assembly factor BamB